MNHAIEKWDLREQLVGFTYERFQHYNQNWLKQGRCMWYATGNIDSEVAIQIAESAQNKIGFQPLAREDILDIRAIAIKPNHSYQIEIPLRDEKNENCCALTYFEIGPMQEDMKVKLTNKILMQIIDEPFFNDLRTQQQLGYVVFSRDFQTRDILGNQLLVQSAKKSCEYLISCINKFLVTIREKYKNLTDEEFETAKKSVHTVLAEKDFNLTKDKIRMWRELFSHKYNF